MVGMAGLLLLLLGGCESLPQWLGAGPGQSEAAEALRRLDGRQQWLEQQVRQLDDRLRQLDGRQRRLEQQERRRLREDRQALEADRRLRRELQRLGPPAPLPPAPQRQQPEQGQTQ